MAKKQRGPAVTAIYLLQQQFGFRKAVWIIEFQARWLLAVKANGWQPINVEQFGEYWAVGRATAYRDQAKWRDLFPEEPTPNDRVMRIRAEYERLVAEQEKEPSSGDVAALFGVLPAA